MRFRFVIDHRQLAGMIAGVLLLSLLSFLGGVSVGLLVQPPPPAAPPMAEVVAVEGPSDPEPDRESAAWQGEVPGPTEVALGTVPGIGERQAAESLRATGTSYGSAVPERYSGDPMETEIGASRRAERLRDLESAEAPRREAGWEPSSSFWRHFAERPPADGTRIQGRRGLRLGFREGQPTPRVRYGEEIYLIGREHDLNPAFLAAIARVESNFDPRAVSVDGAQGLMQVMPETALRFEVEPQALDDPLMNLTAAARYLTWLRRRYDDDPRLVLAAYNAGEGAVDSYGGIPDYPETRNYVERVLSVLGVRR